MKGYEAIEYLKSRREASCIARSEIGKALQSSRTHIALVERVLRTTTRIIEQYAAQLKLKTHYFINEEYEMASLQYTLGQRLKVVRNENNISLRELQARTSIDNSDISNIESGRRKNITLEKLDCLAQGLGVEPIAFYDIENKVAILYPEFRQEEFSF